VRARASCALGCRPAMHHARSEPSEPVWIRISIFDRCTSRPTESYRAGSSSARVPRPPDRRPCCANDRSPVDQTIRRRQGHEGDVITGGQFQGVAGAGTVHIENFTIYNRVVEEQRQGRALADRSTDPVCQKCPDALAGSDRSMGRHIGELQAWNLDTGQKVWSHPFANSQLWGPVLATAGGVLFAW
jgi:hypothetical protein